MNILDVINLIIVAVGIPTIVGFLISFGKKLQVLEDLKPLRDKFPVIESKVNDLWEDRMAPAHSPRQLNDFGLNILKTSGIKNIIDLKKEKLTSIIKETKPENPYDAEQIIMKTVLDLQTHFPELKDDLKTGAFKSGSEIDGVLFVGGVYLRNLIFEELGFSLNDI